MQPKRKMCAQLAVERLETRDCPAAYSIIALMPPPGASGLSSEAFGLNDSGVAVGVSTQASGYSRAAVWQATPGSTRAGSFLPMFAGDNFSGAYDINNSAMIVGTSSVVNGGSHAVVWTSAGVHDLASLGGSFTNDYGAGLSEPDANGVIWVVGGSSYHDGATKSEHATVWRVNASGNTLSTIDLEPTGLPFAGANDVRVVGSNVYVVGSYSVDNVNTLARVWTLDLAGNVLARTDPGTLGGPSSEGNSINSLGHVVGQSKPSATGSNFGFLHRDGVMTNLGSLGNKGSWAKAANDSDTVVGNYWNQAMGDPAGQQPYAYVWQGGTMRNLQAQLSNANKKLWPRLYYAQDINATGQIVGKGALKQGWNFQQRGYLVTPPALHASTVGTTTDTAPISSEDVQPLLADALARWQAAGVDASVLAGIDIRIADLGGTTLGRASGNSIWLDDNAAAWGWFVDPTPGDDSEFNTPGDQGEQNRMDLLTVLTHELGHLLGLDHEHDGVMRESLSIGQRFTENDVDDNDISLIMSFPDSTKRRDPFAWWL